MLEKILITDPISTSGLKILQDAGFEVLYKPKLTDDELDDSWITAIEEEEI